MNTILSINKEQIKQELDKLNSELQVYKNVISAIEKITGKNEIQTIEKIEETILKGTNYFNVEAVAELKGIKTEYNYIKSNLNNFNADNYTNTFEIKEDVLKRIEIANTNYLTNEAEVVKRKLDKVIETLNSINRNYSKTLKQDYQGNWSINLLELHHLTNQIMK